MKTQTGLRAGVTLQELLNNVGTDLRNTAAQAVRALDSAGENLTNSVNQFLDDSNIRETAEKVFWWPMEPPR
jgi:hypothetical protein